MTTFKIENESQEIIVRMLQSDAKKLDIPFEISQDGTSFVTDRDCLNYLKTQIISKLITEDSR